MRGIVYLLLSLTTLPIYIYNLATALSIMGIPEAYSIALGVLITLASLAASAIHLVIYEANRVVYMPFKASISFMGIIYDTQTYWVGRKRTVLSINVGGALIPVTVSAALTYLICVNYPSLAIPMAISILVTSILVNKISRVMPHIGVVTPILAPPILAALASFIMVSFTLSQYPYIAPVIAYVIGVLSTLIGADILNIKKVLDMAPDIADIGGAGTFDGIFFTGILAIFYAAILSALSL